MCPATLSPVYYMYPVYVYPATLAPGARRVPTSAGQAIARAAFVLQVNFFKMFLLSVRLRIFLLFLCLF